MASAVELAARLEALRDVRASGTRKVSTVDIGEVEYRTDSELAAAIADLERQLASAVQPRPKTVVITMKKGV